MAPASDAAVSQSAFIARPPEVEREDPSGVVPTAPGVESTSGVDDWMDARTVLGAPSFAVLEAERARSEVAPVRSTVAPRDALDAALESLTTEADAPSFSSLEIPIDVDEPEPIALEVSIAPQSESAIWEGFEGELGVFLATYDEIPLGTEVTLTSHLTGERPFVSRARVVWLRNAPGVWPGLGLRLLENGPDVWFRMQRFSQRWRAPMFHCE